MTELVIPEGYTVEIYKKDARKKSGERLVSKNDYKTGDLNTLEHTVKSTVRASKGERYEIHKTYVERVTIFGKPFVERYDTPFTCSPASETYWCS